LNFNDLKESKGNKRCIKCM